jgi:hypothetical protein
MALISENQRLLRQLRAGENDALRRICEKYIIKEMPLMKIAKMLGVLSVTMLIVLTGCRAMHETVAFKSTATIVPAEEEDTYVVEAKVIKLDSSGPKEQETLIANPRLKFLVNEEAEFMISNEQEQTGIFMKVFVPQRQSGRAARCSFHIKDKGRTRYLSIFELTLSTD